MIVFLFDEVTNMFSGEYVCQESPLEEGIFITPIHSTSIQPPSFTEEQTCTWNGSEWDLKFIPVPEKVVQDIPEVIPPTLSDLQASLALLQEQIATLAKA